MVGTGAGNRSRTSDGNGACEKGTPLTAGGEGRTGQRHRLYRAAATILGCNLRLLPGGMRRRALGKSGTNAWPGVSTSGAIKLAFFTERSAARFPAPDSTRAARAGCAAPGGRIWCFEHVMAGFAAKCCRHALAHARLASRLLKTKRWRFWNSGGTGRPASPSRHRCLPYIIAALYRAGLLARRRSGSDAARGSKRAALGKYGRCSGCDAKTRRQAWRAFWAASSRRAPRHRRRKRRGGGAAR